MKRGETQRMCCTRRKSTKERKLCEHTVTSPTEKRGRRKA